MHGSAAGAINGTVRGRAVVHLDDSGWVSTEAPAKGVAKVSAHSRCVTLQLIPAWLAATEHNFCAWQLNPSIVLSCTQPKGAPGFFGVLGVLACLACSIQLALSSTHMLGRHSYSGYCGSMGHSPRRLTRAAAVAPWVGAQW
jgi:hypothetical protein